MSKKSPVSRLSPLISQSSEATMTALATSYRHILFECDGPIAFVTMNRPEKRNALSVEHMQELTDCFKAIGADQGLAVAVLRGNGPAFCAGHDLSEMVGQTKEFYQHEFAICTTLMETILDIPQPVIAQIHGVATAAGCQLAATCDMVVAAEEARFATPGVKIGLFCSTPMVALSRAVGTKKAIEMLLTGEFMSAREAREAGLVNRVVPAADLERETHALAGHVAEASPLVVGIGKRAFYRQLDLPLHEAYAYASDVMVANAALEDAQEGMCAFLEKRRPQWRNR
jgi:enoyl-CoA hydratase/carnithine racemase